MLHTDTLNDSELEKFVADQNNANTKGKQQVTSGNVRMLQEEQRKEKT